MPQGIEGADCATSMVLIHEKTANNRNTGFIESIVIEGCGCIVADVSSCGSRQPIWNPMSASVVLRPSGLDR